MSSDTERTNMSINKDKTASLGSVAFRRTRREADADTDASNRILPSTSSERTYVTASGTAPRAGRSTGAGKSGTRGPPRQEPTYRLSPNDDGRFAPGAVEQLVQEVLVTRLRDQTYDATTCKQLSQELAAAIMEELKSLSIRRYKMVAVVSIGSLSERPGLQFGSRCLWDDATDSFASVKFTNGSLFAVAMIYGLYYE